MLNDTDVKEINRILSTLIVIDKKSNNRYKLDQLLGPLQAKFNIMKLEPEILRKLESYHVQFGINTYSYLNKGYTDIETFKKEMTQLLAACEKLKNLIPEYRPISSKMPVNNRRELEQLLIKPEKVEEASRLFYNLKGRII